MINPLSCWPRCRVAWRRLPFPLVIGLLWLLPMAVVADPGQEPVKASWPLARGAAVSVEVPAGHLRVVGWDRPRLAIEGWRGDGVDGLRSTVDGQTAVLVLRGRPTADGGTSNDASREVEVTVHVPRHCRLQVRGFAAEIVVEGLLATVEAQTLDGDIRISGRPDEVETRTLGGHQVLELESRRVRSRSLTGTLEVSGVVHSLETSNLSGTTIIEVASAGVMKLSSASGRITFSGELAPAGRLDIETVGGEVDLSLAEDPEVDVQLASPRGEIELGAFGGRQSVDGDTGGGSMATQPPPADPLHRFVRPGTGPRVRVSSQTGRLRLLTKAQVQPAQTKAQSTE